MASSHPTDFQCPNCGADVHPNARACKKCGRSHGRDSPASRSRPSWQQPEHLDGIDLPPDSDNDPAFDYDEFVAKEFGDGNNRPIVIDARKIIWWLTAVILLIAFAYWAVRGW